MKKLILATLLSLSGCVSSPALAGVDCRSTQEAMAYAAAHGVRATILRGETMAPFIAAARQVNAIEMETISFVAVIMAGEGAMAFFGNFSQVCGPLLLSKDHLNIMLRPA